LIIFSLVIVFWNVDIKVSHYDDWTMFGRCWIIIWSVLKNVETEDEWALYTHTICFFFCVLILKVVAIFYEPSLVIILKKFKCMCMSYIIINPWLSWIEIYEYFNEFINLCTTIDARSIFVFIRHRIWDIWKLWSCLTSS
jgi:hypothetical protein